MTITLLATLAHGADCPAGVPLSGWSSTLGAAENAYRSFESEAFDDAVDAAALDLRCLSDVVSRDAAARFHVLSGLRMYIRTRTGDAVVEFAAARAADPAFVVDETLVPAGHELRSLIPNSVSGPTETFPAPIDGVTLMLDGAETPARPIDRPVIVQVVGPDGAIRETTYVMPGDALPAYPTALVSADSPSSQVRGPRPPPPPVQTKPRWALLGASGVAAGASVVLYALAARSEAKFNAQLPEEYGKDELVGLRKQTNGLVWGSIVAGGVATGGMVAFVVVR